MAIKIASNISSLNNQRRLNEASNSLADIYQRLSSGQRINRASDDAAGLAIADELNAKSRVYAQAIRNGNDGISLLNIADSALDALTSVVIRIRELAEQSANGSYSSSQRTALDTEAQQLTKEFTRITQSTSFNGIRIFDGSLGSGVNLQLGYGSNESINASIGGAISNGSFETPVLYTAEASSSRSITFADLNADGILDMITGGNAAASGAVNISLGLGDGSFGQATSYSTITVTSVIATDLNGDGILDLATSGARSTVRFGIGDGTFGSATTYTMDTNNASTIQAADLNNDGIVDLITGGNSVATGTITVRLGTGNGTFGNSTSFSAGSTNAFSIALGDLNSDGILDLASTGSGGASFIRMGNGDGSFGTATSYSIGSVFGTSVALGDVNNDGILDLVSSAVIGTIRSSVRLGNGDGTFGSSSNYTTGISTTRSTVLGDMNGDGNLDIVFAGYGAGVGQVSVLLGSGNGSFGTATVSSTGGTKAWNVAVADINNDGVLDIAAAGEDVLGKAMLLISDTRDGLGSLLSFSLKSRQDSLRAMGMLDTSLSNLSKQRGAIGASQSRVGFALNNLQSANENFIAAESRIRDADIAADSAELVRTQILQQAATSVLAQSNQLPALALKLLM